MDTDIKVVNPFLIMYEGEGGIITRLHASPDATVASYGLMVADLIRHIADHFNADVAEVVDWVNRELNNPTTPIERAN